MYRGCVLSAAVQSSRSVLWHFAACHPPLSLIPFPVASQVLLSNKAMKSQIKIFEKLKKRMVSSYWKVQQGCAHVFMQQTLK